MIRLQHKHFADAFISVLLDRKAFDLKSFVDEAPTGIEGPPERRQMGDETFYFYGPGGGGVAYADRYYFDLKGKTLLFTFSGPYINSNTPSQETKNIEQLLLMTFRTFPVN